MASPLLVSLALVSSALPAAAPLDQLFQDHRVEVPSLSLGGRNTDDLPLVAPPPAADLPTFGVFDTRPAPGKRAPEMRGLMPNGKPLLLDPKLVHAPVDKDIDYKLIVKEVKVTPAK